MTVEEIKTKLLELCIPLDTFMQEHGIASFSLDNAGEDKAATLSISCCRIPLPSAFHSRIRNVLGYFGSIYFIDAIQQKEKR